MSMLSPPVHHFPFKLVLGSKCRVGNMLGFLLQNIVIWSYPVREDRNARCKEYQDYDADIAVIVDCLCLLVVMIVLATSF
jgi:hypothetical protein